jgi:aconitate hydratase
VAGLHEEAREYLETYRGRAALWNLRRLEEAGVAEVSKLPYAVRVLLENMLRNWDGSVVDEAAIRRVARWREHLGEEIPYKPSRVLLQDFTGVPAVVDLAAMRDAMKELGGDPAVVNPLIPADLVIDHSVQVDFYGASYAYERNIDREFERNSERYRLLKWAQRAFTNLRVVPPGKGIVHQVNLEYLAQVVHLREFRGELAAFPDTVIGTDSHTTMVAGLGVLGWGVGGIEAEAVMLGQPYYITIPEVVGVELVGELREGATATDLVLTVTELLRRRGVVGKIVEFTGPGAASLTVPDRATVSNMAPEYGATTGFFPVDQATLEYLQATGRDPRHVELVRAYCSRVGLLAGPETPRPEYTETLRLDLGDVEPSLAGPTNPEDRVPLREAKRRFIQALQAYLEDSRRRGLAVSPEARAPLAFNGVKAELTHGNVVIAAITSCTNTSNPSVMVGAGLVAKKAVERGLFVKPWVKTSLAPGSMVVIEYLAQAGLLPYLEAQRFHLVGYGCTTCIGNSGSLPPAVEAAIKEADLYAVSVLSGNRNFEGRIHPLSRANYLASPMLVVVYALAGRMDIDLEREPLGHDANGNPVYLRDIWPSQKEIQAAVRAALKPEAFLKRYGEIFKGDPRWEGLEVPDTELYSWDPNSTYIKRPPFLEGIGLEARKPKDIRGARALVVLGDRITTDHISPAGAIPANSPAGRYLKEWGVRPLDFNTYGSRRGNHEVMMRGTFANVRLRNHLVPDREGGWTVHLPDGAVMPVYDAAMIYQEEGVPLIVLAGRQYGAGSSRDWAAKGPYLLGVRAVIAESFERIHRSNLVGMGILPLQFEEGQGWRSLGLTGREVYDILGIEEGLEPGKKLTVKATREDGSTLEFTVRARLDSQVEVEYYQHGGILPAVLRKLYQGSLGGEAPINH